MFVKPLSSTSSSEPRSPPSPGGKSQRQFLFRLTLFWAPILCLCFALVEAILYSTGESWTVDHVLRVQGRRKDSLFLRKWIDQQFFLYKLKAIRGRKPGILAVGSSRVM